MNLPKEYIENILSVWVDQHEVHGYPTSARRFVLRATRVITKRWWREASIETVDLKEELLFYRKSDLSDTRNPFLDFPRIKNLYNLKRAIDRHIKRKELFFNGEFLSHADDALISSSSAEKDAFILSVINAVKSQIK